MNAYNMLGARKVKLHGMKADKYSTADKITQYKGLIRLYNRDRAINEADAQVKQRRYAKELTLLLRQNAKDKNRLENARQGDREALRVALADHKDLQIAFEGSPPQTMIQCVQHLIFRKRKELDLLIYKLQSKEAHLTNIKFEGARLEEHMNGEQDAKLPNERKSVVVAGQVQDAILRSEAAVVVNRAYRQVIAIMKRDAMYFEAVLDSLSEDGLKQNKCLISGTILGQLAMEYLDDRRQEYKTLEKLVLKDMASRKVDLAIAEEHINNISKNLQEILRPEEDINTGVMAIQDTYSYTKLKEEFSKTEEILKTIKYTTKVYKFEDIFPCLQEQQDQSQRLVAFVKKGKPNHQALIKKLKLARIMRKDLKEKMERVYAEYKNKKVNMFKQMHKLDQKRKTIKNIIEQYNDLIANIRIGLDQLQQLLKNLSETKRGSGTLQTFKFKSSVSVKRTSLSPSIPDLDEKNSNQIIKSLIPKLERLIQNTKDNFEMQEDPKFYNTAFDYYEILVKDNTHIHFTKEMSEERLLEGLTIEVSHVLTREDIKRISAEIVEENSHDPDNLPIFNTARPRK